MVFNTMYTLSHEASRMGEATGPRLQDGVSLVPGRDSACALEAVAHDRDRVYMVLKTIRSGQKQKLLPILLESRPLVLLGTAGMLVRSHRSLPKPAARFSSPLKL